MVISAEHREWDENLKQTKNPMLLLYKFNDFLRFLKFLKGLLCLKTFENLFVCFKNFWQGFKLWIIMEYLGGGSAQDIIRMAPFMERDIAIIMREILKGLDYLHNERKVHRDIKGK